MSKKTRKSKSIDRIIKRSLELFGLTPEEITEKNKVWMLKNGYISKLEKKRYLK